MRNIDDMKTELQNASLNLEQEHCRSIDLFPIGAPTKERAIELVRNFDDEIVDNLTEDEYSSILEAAWRSVRGPSRWIIAGRGPKGMRQSVADFVLKDKCAASGVRHNTPRKITFVFSGMGPQWGGMGRQLAESLPRFAEHIQKIDALFVEFFGKSVWEELEQHKDAKQLPTDLAQTGNFLIQAALYNLLRDEDIAPEAIIGHSAGEVAAAYAAGVYTLEEGVRVAIARGTLQASLAGRGSMLAVGLSGEEATKLIEGIEGVSIAAINDDKGVTLSGDSAEIEKIDAQLQEQKTFSKMLRVEVPYHSPVMDEITDQITSDLAFLDPSQAKIKLYSTVSGGHSDGPEWDGSYWARNIRQPVLFAETLKQILNDGYNCFIEIAPHPVLSQSIDKLSGDFSGISIHHLITRRDHEYETFVGSVAELAIDSVGRPQKQRVSAPLLKPVTEAKELWEEHPDATAARRGDLAAADLPLLGQRMPGPIPSFDTEISTTDYPWVAGHTVQELGAIVPATMWAEMIAIAAAEGERKSVRLTDLRIVASLPVSDNPTVISTKIEGGIAKCQSRALGSTTGWTLHAVASIASIADLADDTAKPKDLPEALQAKTIEVEVEVEVEVEADGADAETKTETKTEIQSRTVLPATTGTRVDAQTLYQAFRMKGLNYEGAFKNLTDVVIEAGDEAWAIIESPEAFEEGHHSPWVLDAGLQLLIAAAKDWGELMYLPFRIGNVNLHQPLVQAGDYQAHARVSVRNEFELIGSVSFYDLNGKLLVELEDIACLRNFSDDAERINYLDRNTYTIGEFTPEEIVEQFTEEEEEEEANEAEAQAAPVEAEQEAAEPTEEEEAETQLEEYWIADAEATLPFDRPRIELEAIDDKLEANLLWMQPNSGDLQADALAATKIIQAVSKPNNGAITLTIIADQGQAWLSGLRRSACNAYSCDVRAVFIDKETSSEMLEAAVSLTEEHEIVFEGDEPLMRRLAKVTSEQIRATDDVIEAEENRLPDSTLYFELAKGQLCIQRAPERVKRG
jgi:acyl transferase domain-containing protein